MGMVVRTNTMSTNAYRQLGMNNTSVSKSLEKLSSGFRINRAGDDASGLAISEKMKAQINGLEQASANSQDGISLIQTAEGATTEIHNMLNRMVTLATKSANGTIQNEVDRDAIQTEVDALNTEITRIAKATNFNGINLLDGSLGEGGKSTQITGTVAGAGVVVTETPAAKGAYTSGALTQTGTAGALSSTITVAYTDKSGASKTADVTFNSGTDATASAANFLTEAKKNSDLTSLFDITGDNTGMVFTAKNAGIDKGAVTGITVKTAGTDGVAVATGSTTTAAADVSYASDLSGTFAAGDKLEINGKTYTYMAGYDGNDGENFSSLATLKTAADKNGVTLDITPNTAVTATTKNGSGLTLQVGDTNDAFNKVSVAVDDLTAEGLGVAGLDVSSQDAAGAAIQTIKDAINQVSTNRGNLGALQNRLEYTINNLDTTNENMTSANSRIRDTDMAKEMMNYTKMNILTQAAQSMLAQANQQPQQILQLLQ